MGAAGVGGLMDAVGALGRGSGGSRGPLMPALQGRKKMKTGGDINGAN